MKHNEQIRVNIESIKKATKEKRREIKKSIRKYWGKWFLILLSITLISFMTSGENNFGMLMSVLTFFLAVILIFSEIVMLFQPVSDLKEEANFEVLGDLVSSNNSLPTSHTYCIKLGEDNLSICNDVKIAIFDIYYNDILNIKIDDKSYETISTDSYSKAISSEREENINILITYQADNEVNEMTFNNPSKSAYNSIFSKLPKQKVQIA